MTVALAFDGVSKHYRGAGSYRSLREDLGGLGRLVGRRRAPPRVVRALDDVSFEVPVGESFALIGENGAGKSTALKIATRISYPTAGTVRVRGRVGALIEVGTGLHPELTGRENVQLFGTILGHTRRDVDRRFDEIVDFSGIGAAIDQPVKQYSSGMELRIGFAIASHLEPDVLLVDEAIAVGDAGFHSRCVERMADLVREGRTLVFVSHDMPAIEALCQRAAWLVRGRIRRDGPATAVVREYLADVERRRVAEPVGTGAVDGDLVITAVTLHDDTGREVEQVPHGRPLTVRLHYRARRPVPRPGFTVGLCDGAVGCFAVASMLEDGAAPDALAGTGAVDCRFAALPLQPKTYEVWGSILGAAGYGDLLTWQRLRRFEVVPAPDDDRGPRRSSDTVLMAPVTLPYTWVLGSDPPAGARVDGCAGYGGRTGAPVLQSTQPDQSAATESWFPVPPG